MNREKTLTTVLAIVSFVVVLMLIVIGNYLVKKYSPSDERADLYGYYGLTDEEEMSIVLEDEILKGQALYINEHVYLPYEFVRDYINPRFYWDFNEELLLYTTVDTIVRTQPLTADYYVGNKKVTGDFGEIVKLQAGRAFINMEYVDLYSDFSYTVYTQPNRVIIELQCRTMQQVSVKKDAEIRILAGIKSPVLKSVSKGEVLEILGDEGKWTKVRSQDGFIGYIKDKVLGKAITQELVIEVTEEEFEHRYADGPVCMGWHQVDVKANNNAVEEILDMADGITVISPTWFYLSDNYGGIGSLASKEYVDYCHKQGVEVWALINNLTDGSVNTTEVLTHTSYRENLVNKLISAAIEYKLDGINLDLESLERREEVGDAYVQLIRELALKCHANGLTLSVDNYVPTSYTSFYDRAQQALYADYIVVMAYDEHYVGSEAGSVSSYGFVENGIADTLKEVPKEQVILGLPFYCRVWVEIPEYDENGQIVSISTKSTSYGIAAAEKVMADYGVVPTWDETVGQYFVQFEADGKVYKIWWEEERSIELKLKLMEEYELAGVSFWKLGRERSQTWDVIEQYLRK